MRILVVDDSEDSRDITEAALLSAGYKDVRTASSAWEAFKILDLGRTGEAHGQGQVGADIVLLDIVMPEIDGIEACARIRNDANYTDIPIIMITSLEDMDSLANAFVAGATDYVHKPVNRVELIARVRAALKLKAELERRHTRERELLAFMSSWGDRYAKLWVDDTTGLLVGEAAETYLATATAQPHNKLVSILALEVDRLNAFRSRHGEEATRSLLAQVARAVRSLPAPIGLLAAAYRDGLIVLVAPDFDAAAAKQLAESLCAAVSKLRLINSESIVADYVTASVSAVTGQVHSGIDRVQLMTRAISAVRGAAAAGGNRVTAESL